MKRNVFIGSLQKCEAYIFTWYKLSNIVEHVLRVNKLKVWKVWKYL
jgi:hypothetical protein